MSNFDWSRFTVRINVKASTEKLYWCWATKEGIEFWFLRRSDYKKNDGAFYGANEFVKKGDKYSWWWHGYPDEVVEHGEILDAMVKIFSNLNLEMLAIARFVSMKSRVKKSLSCYRIRYQRMKKESKTGI